jgi:hypothetical protein
MAQISPKTVYFKNPKFWQSTLFIGVSTYVIFRMEKKSLRIGTILGKNLEESRLYERDLFKQIRTQETPISTRGLFVEFYTRRKIKPVGKFSVAAS